MVLEKRVTTFIIAREKPFAENGTNGTEEQPLIESACTRCNKFTNEISRHKDYFFFCPVFHLHLCKTARQVIFVGHSRPLALLIAHYRKSQHLPRRNSRWHTYFAQSRASAIRKETRRCPKHPAYQCPRDTNKKKHVPDTRVVWPVLLMNSRTDDECSFALLHSKQPWFPNSQ